MRNTIIGGVILAIATFAIQKVYFTDKTEIVYSLSNDIYTSLIDSEDRQVIQQLTIKNIGAQRAERVVISINEPIDTYDLQKYSELDSVHVINTKTKFELIYPFLPPNGQIEVLLKNKNKGIGKNNLVVKHDFGLGKEVFQKNDTFSIAIALPLLACVVYILWTVRHIYMDSFGSDVKYNPVDKILNRSKPLWLSSVKWNELRKEALEHYFRKDTSYTKLNALSCWQVLNNEKPHYLTNNEWTRVVNDAIRKFKDIFTEMIITRSYLTLSEDLFSIEKPKQFSFSDWKEILNLINNYYIYYQFGNKSFAWMQNPSEQLSTQKPNLIDNDVDKKYKTIVREAYFTKIVSNLLRRDDSNVLQHYDLSLLEEDQRNEINKISARLGDIKKAQQYYFKLREVTVGQLKPTENDLIDKGAWENLVTMDQKIADILKNEKLAEEDRIKFANLRHRVEKQLDIIDRILSDPDYVTKIEDYNDAFSSGNLKNLKKLSSDLKRTKAM